MSKNLTNRSNVIMQYLVSIVIMSVKPATQYDDDVNVLDAMKSILQQVVFSNSHKSELRDTGGRYLRKAEGVPGGRGNCEAVAGFQCHVCAVEWHTCVPGILLVHDVGT